MSVVQFLVLTTSRRRARRQLLVDSVLREHPEAPVTSLWCDPRLPVAPGPDVVLAHRVMLDRWRWQDLALAAGARTSAWAALPWILAERPELTASGPVVVLDDTFVLHGRLDDLIAAGAPVALARRVDPDTGVAWGGPAPGLLVVDDADSPLMRWWRARTVEWMTRPELDGDSPWWSSVGGLDLSADDRFRLSPHCSAEVDLRLEDDGVWTASGALALVDMGDLDPTRPWWFAAGDEQPGRLTSESPALRSLCQRYADDLLAAGWSAEQDRDDDLLVPGVRLAPALRRWFRERCAGPEPVANPYVAGEVRAFVDQLAGPGRPDGTGVSVAADLVYDERDDLQHAFASPRWRDRSSFGRWLWTSGLSEGEVALATLPAPPQPTPTVQVRKARAPFGVNLVGYLGAELGLGVAARQMREALESAGVPTSTVTYDRTSSHQERRSDGGTDRPYHVNLLLIVPDQLSLFVADVGPEFLQGHHNIGLWYWESDVMSDSQLPAFDHVDEVWAATTYLRDAFASAGRAPVSLVPSPLEFEPPVLGPDDRARLGLDDRFSFLFSFDFLSVVERKNPLGLVDAYCRAFGPDDGTRLVLKSINGDVFPRDREQLAAAIADRPDIDLWDRHLPAQDRLALVAAADCYVSLHRAEGLGLTMAEAMAAGTPVVATGYSGNLDFMDDRSALLVPYELVEVGPGRHYPAHGHWASPDLDVAAQHLRAVRDDPALRDRLVRGAKEALEPYTVQRVGRIARDRLLESWKGAAQSR
jgi:glycosyltransferase involved in cell wall biosynthesis